MIFFSIISMNVIIIHLALCRSFDDFLMDIKQSKRKNIRQERKKVWYTLLNYILIISCCIIALHFLMN